MVRPANLAKVTASDQRIDGNFLERADRHVSMEAPWPLGDPFVIVAPSVANDLLIRRRQLMTSAHHWPLRTVEVVGAGRALLLRVVRLLIGRHGEGLKRDTTFAANFISQVAQVSRALSSSLLTFNYR